MIYMIKQEGRIKTLTRSTPAFCSQLVTVKWAIEGFLTNFINTIELTPVFSLKCREHTSWLQEILVH